MKTAGICEHGNPAKHSVAHEKRGKRAADRGIFYPGKYQKYVHRNTAQLEWKIPPIIMSVFDDGGEVPLLPYLAYGQCRATEIQEIPAPGLYCSFSSGMGFHRTFFFFLCHVYIVIIIEGLLKKCT